MEKVKLLIIGGGPGGYVAAIRAAQLGLKPVLIEKEHLGGTCLNWGCIPTKALIAAAETYRTIHNASQFGIEATASFNWPDVVAHAEKTVMKNRKGVEYLFKKNKITLIKGTAEFIDTHKIKVNDEEIEAENIIIATGSIVKDLPHIAVNGDNIISSNEALFLDNLPESIAIIGAGAIGVEFAFIMRSFGVTVHLIEAKDKLVPLEDKDISRELLRSFKKQKIKCHVGVCVEEINKTDNGNIVSLSNGKTITVEKILSAVGRKPNTESINLDVTEVALDKHGFIPVNATFETSQPGIFAIGDVIATPMLAHTAEHEGIIAVEYIAGHATEEIDYRENPACTYCEPAIASIGLTEDTAKEMGINIRTGSFPFSANGKAIASGHTTGFVKVVIDDDDGTILGAHIIGHGATDLISEFIPAMKLGATAHDIIESIHPHPTLSEASLEAVLNALDRTIHI